MSHSCKNIMIGFGERNKQDETHVTKNTVHGMVPDRPHDYNSTLSETYTYRTHDGLLPKEH